MSLSDSIREFLDGLFGRKSESGGTRVNPGSTPIAMKSTSLARSTESVTPDVTEPSDGTTSTLSQAPIDPYVPKERSKLGTLIHKHPLLRSRKNKRK